MRLEKLHAWLLGSYALVFAWSLYHPRDYFTWFLEVLPGLIGLSILAYTYNRFRFSNMVYVVIWIHCIILTIGAKYTYAEVPLFNWIRDEFGLMRNNYDKVGHFYQGFGPALIMREMFLRLNIVKRGKWMVALIILSLLGLAAIYELIEWWVAVAIGQSADAFIGAQGYEWDTQSDMFMCLLGSLVSLGFLAKWHDRALERHRST